MEKDAYTGIIPDEQVEEMKEHLAEKNADRHSSFQNEIESFYEQGLPPQKCTKNAIFYSTDLRGHRNSGLFTEVGRVDDIKECIQHCCVTPKCDLAYMDKMVCYTVICHFPSLCQPVKSARSHVSLGYIERNGVSVFDPDTYPTGSLVPKKTTKKPVTTKTTQRLTCLQSMVYYSVALRGGWTAGKFTDMGIVRNLKECVKHCCNDSSCDLAMVLSRKCFTVHCYNLADCQTIPDGHAQIAYVSRDGQDGVGKFILPIVRVIVLI